MDEIVDPELRAVIQEVADTLPEIIRRLRIEIGRTPTEAEVKNFFWAEDDDARRRVILEARERD